MEAPICCDVFVMAEVTPTSLGSAFWVAVLMQGTMASPKADAQEELARQDVGHVGGVGGQTS